MAPKRGRPKGVTTPPADRVEGGSPSSSSSVKIKPEPLTDRTRRSGRVTRSRLALTPSSPPPFSPPPGFAASDTSPSLARYQACNSNPVLDRCTVAAMLKSPVQNIKALFPSRATGDSLAHLTTETTHATEENVDEAVQAKLEIQFFPTIHDVFRVETQNLRQQSETVPSLPEVAVENNAPPSNTGVLNTNAAGQESRSVQSGTRPTKSGSVDLTRIVALMNDNSSDDEVESRLDPLSASINGYSVKEEAAPVLRRIFDKYGNIAVQCSFTSMISSSLLEVVCDIYKMLEGKDFTKITNKELESMLAVVRELESAKLDVGWLHQRLADISEAKKLVQEYGILKKAKDKNHEEMEKNKRALRELKDELAAYTATCRVLEERIREKEGELGSGNKEKERIMQSFQDAKTNGKVRSFLNGSLVHDLL